MTELELLRETLADYCKVRKTLPDLSDLSLVAVRRTRVQVAADTALFEKVNKALGSPNGGWARFRSELGWICQPPPCFETSGPPIMAEWLDNEDVAYRLTPAPNIAGQALIVSVHTRPLGQSDSLGDDEEPALCQSLEVLAHPRVAPFTHIAYKVYWGLLPNGSSSATRRLFDRFAGFIEKQEG